MAKWDRTNSPLESLALENGNLSEEVVTIEIDCKIIEKATT